MKLGEFITPCVFNTRVKILLSIIDKQEHMVHVAEWGLTFDPFVIKHRLAVVCAIAAKCKDELFISAIIYSEDIGK